MAKKTSRRGREEDENRRQQRVLHAQYTARDARQQRVRATVSGGEMTETERMITEGMDRPSGTPEEQRMQLAHELASLREATRDFSDDEFEAAMNALAEQEVRRQGGGAAWSPMRAPLSDIDYRSIDPVRVEQMRQRFIATIRKDRDQSKLEDPIYLPTRDIAKALQIAPARVIDVERTHYRGLPPEVREAAEDAARAVMEASKQVPVEVRRSLAAEKVANLRNDFFNKKFEELQQRDREKLSALEERGISDTAGYGVRGAQANKMTAREYTRQEFDKIEARARKMRAALAGHAVSGPLTDTQIAYAQTHTMPGRHATAARVTAATRQEMETVPYEDVFGEHTWRVPILEKKADEQGVFQVKAGTEGVIGQHLTPATTGALVHLTGKVKIKPTDDTWRRMEAAAAEAEHGVDRLRDARREFVRIVYRYQKYSSDERRITMKQADQRGMNLPNAPYDRGRALQLMQEFGFRLPEWSKIKVPAAWR